MAKFDVNYINHEDKSNRASGDYWQFGTKIGVQYTQKEFEQAIQKQKKEETINLYSRALEDLSKTTKEQEKKFYEDMKLPDNPKTALDELQKRIDDWNLSGAKEMLSAKVANEILQLLNFDYEQLSETLEKAFYSKAAKEALLEHRPIQNTIKEVVMAEINNLAEKQSKRGFISSSSSKRGLLKYMHTVTFGANQVKIKFDENTPSHYGRRIISLMKKDLDSDYEIEEGYVKETPDSLREKVLDVLRKNGVSEKAIEYIHHPLEKEGFISTYGFYSSLPSIKGALAEVYWNATFQYLMQKKNIHGQVVPTGFIKDNKKQINVDMILDAYGFQIKNYTIKEGILEFKDSNKQIGVLLRDRAEVESSLLETLVNFFASWSYNQVNNNYENAQKEYGPTFARFESLAPGVEEVLKMHLDKIMGISKMMKDASAPIGLENYLRLNEGYYKNTFFLINDKIVPSSQILLALRDVLKKDIKIENQKILFSSSVSAPSNPKSASVWPYNFKHVEEQKYTYANRTRVSYSIKIKIFDILKEAYQRI